MFPADIKIGYIFRYSYLWHRQYVQGRREGEKDRPCLVLAIVKTDENGKSVVRVLPITHAPPNNPVMQSRSCKQLSCGWVLITRGRGLC